MARIECCGKDRKVKETTRLVSRILGFSEEILYEGQCPQCKNQIKASAGIHPIFGIIAQEKIDRVDFGHWLERKKLDFKATVESRVLVQRPSRQAVYVSAYTTRVSGGVIVRDDELVIKCSA